MRKLNKGRTLLGLRFSLSVWISKQYIRVLGETEFEDQLMKSGISNWHILG
jgi:hypothetical protein